ncbi:MAG: ABC transporter ATP-binding protein [Oscillospiraceae bacterium]
MNITMSGLNKCFDQKQVLFDIDFSIHAGDIVCLLGPSGSGKTTLIRCLIGAIKAEQGQITYDDIAVPNLKLMKKIGFMPQNDALYDDLTGENNLRFFGELYRFDKKRLNERITEVLKLVDLEEDRKKYVRNYSGGMKKRLSLAAAMLHEPDVLLLDEPTVGIDPVLRRTIWNQFKDIKAAGKTIIVSTHVMDEVAECDKAALIYNGRLISYDTVENLLSETQSGKVEELFFKAAENQKGADAV